MPKKQQPSMKLYAVLSPILYSNPASALLNNTIRPSDNYAVPFPHLSAGEIALLARRRVIRELTPEEAETMQPVPLKETTNG